MLDMFCCLILYFSLISSSSFWKPATVFGFSAPAWHFSSPVVHFAFNSGCWAQKFHTQLSPMSSPVIVQAFSATAEGCRGIFHQPFSMIHSTRTSFVMTITFMWPITQYYLYYIYFLNVSASTSCPGNSKTCCCQTSLLGMPHDQYMFGAIPECPGM